MVSLRFQVGTLVFLEFLIIIQPDIIVIFFLDFLPGLQLIILIPVISVDGINGCAIGYTAAIWVDLNRCCTAKAIILKIAVQVMTSNSGHLSPPTKNAMEKLLLITVWTFGMWDFFCGSNVRLRFYH
jgi:hypothetical protein